MLGQHALALGRAVLALQPGDDPRGGRRPDAEREARGDHLVARREILRRAQDRGLEIVGQFRGLDHGEVVLGLHADYGGLRLEAVEEHDLELRRAAHDVQVREDDAGVDDDHAGPDPHAPADVGMAVGQRRLVGRFVRARRARFRRRGPALRALAVGAFRIGLRRLVGVLAGLLLAVGLLVVLRVAGADDLHDRRAHRLVGFRRPRRERLRRERVQHRAVDVLLREEARRGPRGRPDGDRDRTDQQSRHEREPAFVALRERADREALARRCGRRVGRRAIGRGRARGGGREAGRGGVAAGRSAVKRGAAHRGLHGAFRRGGRRRTTRRQA